MDVSLFQLPGDLPVSEQSLSNLISEICSKISFKPDSISIVFVSDKELAAFHKEYLNDPDVTDVITFNLGEKNIEGEIYISVDRAKEQSTLFNVTFPVEVLRLIIHGILHLAGYDDIDEIDRSIMKELENNLVEEFSSYLVN